VSSNLAGPMCPPFRLVACSASRRFAFLAASLASACTTPVDTPPTTDRPTLRLIDSVLLEETDSSLLADPGPYFVVDPTGRMYIPDNQAGKVQRYRPNGELDLTFGRRGQGPGEFGFVGPALLVADTMLLVEANFQRRVTRSSEGTTTISDGTR
jgi:hypothetical protein